MVYYELLLFFVVLYYLRYYGSLRNPLGQLLLTHQFHYLLVDSGLQRHLPILPCIHSYLKISNDQMTGDSILLELIFEFYVMMQNCIVNISE